jgi:hypothetical protein
MEWWTNGVVQLKPRIDREVTKWLERNRKRVSKQRVINWLKRG